MNCFCCGKPLPENEAAAGWHNACIRRFFGTSRLPELDLSEQTLQRLVRESTEKGYTVPGVQKKLSLHLGYILKPQVDEYTALPEAEQLVMCMAETCGIQTVPHALIRTGNSLSYITKRVDRIFGKDDSVKMLAMEDFCQLDLRLTQDKYRGSYERCAKVIQRYSSRPGLDMSELFFRLVFSFLVGNSDMHLKNFSLLETEERSGRYVLSPAYDLLPVNVIMPEDTEEFALTINGKKRNLHRKDFFVFADTCGLNRKQAENIMLSALSRRPRMEKMIRESLLPDDYKEALSGLLYKRAEKLA